MVTQQKVWWDHLVDDLATELLLHKSVGSIQEYGMLQQYHQHLVVDIWIRIRNIELHFAIFSNTFEGHFENIEYGERTATGYAWSVTDKVTAEEVCWEIFSCIADREEEKASEVLCLERIRSYGFSHAYTSSVEEDLQGIDLFVPYKGYLVPLQLKQSARGQYEHRKHYPRIPSLVYSNFHCNPTVEKRCIENILGDYTHGHIAHLNVHMFHNE